MVDVTDANFEAEVLERSRELPVVVDLWAPWCGPCKTLGPILEGAIEATGGRVLLAKVNVDENPEIARAFQVQSIPAVFALRDAKVVDAFVGAQGETAVAAFIAKLVPEVSEADLLLEAGDLPALEKAHALEPERADIAYALARALLEDGQPAAVAPIVLPLSPDPEAEALLAAAAEGLDDLSQVFATVTAELEPLLDQVKTDEAARARYLALLEELPAADARTVALRRALSSRLF